MTEHDQQQAEIRRTILGHSRRIQELHQRVRKHLEK
jgi:hypothetical protein